ncbi:MAG: class I SAM-dependent methyltransferase [Thermoplasmata archaeon]
MDRPHTTEVAESWDGEYRAGRYAGEAPVPFVHDILTFSRQWGIARGLYVGCGNGRNFIPLSDAGLDLTGLDVSSVAIEQLARRAPQYRGRLLVGEVDGLPAGTRFPLVIGIQVFQHGDRAVCHVNLVAAQERLERGGLFCLRVNAVGTEYQYATERIEAYPEGSETIRYRSGPKQGLLVHFFSERELAALFAGSFQPLLPLRRVVSTRPPPAGGHWDQWEGIWRKS